MHPATYDRDVVGSIVADCRLATPRIGLVAMLKAFWDESGTGDQETQPIMTLAGWVFDINELRIFERHWRRVLKHPDFDVPEAKASDLRARTKAYAGWDDDKALRFRLALSRVLERHVLYGVAMSVVRGAYHRVIREKIDAGLLGRGSVYKDEYTWVMQTSLEHLIGWQKLRQRDRIACIFDEGKTKRMHDSFVELRDAKDGPIGPSGRIVREYRGVRSIDVCAVQAADFLASGVRIGTWERVTGLTPDRIEIGTLHLPDVEVLGGYYDEAAMREALIPITPQPRIVSVTFTPAPRDASKPPSSEEVE